MKRFRLPSALVLATLLAACASTGSSGGGRGSGNVLTYDNLVASNQPTIYMAIQSLRPLWLRTRGQGSLGGSTVVTVFVDGVSRGNAANLDNMRITDVVDVTYFSASDAAFRFGTTAGNGGTIEVRTGR